MIAFDFEIITYILLGSIIFFQILTLIFIIAFRVKKEGPIIEFLNPQLENILFRANTRSFQISYTQRNRGNLATQLAYEVSLVLIFDKEEHESEFHSEKCYIIPGQVEHKEVLLNFIRLPGRPRLARFVLKGSYYNLDDNKIEFEERFRLKVDQAKYDESSFIPKIG